MATKLEKIIPVTQKLKTEIEYSLYTVLKIGNKSLDFNESPIFQIGRNGHQHGRNRPKPLT
jgi:hypothetical protein